MTVLVTGATGFIGSALVRYLGHHGHRVRALAHRVKPAPLENGGESGIELVWGDLTDPKAMLAAMDGVDTVFHLAGQRDVWGLDKAVYTQVNFYGTRHLLEAAARAQVRRFVHCSSVGVARYPRNLQANESLPYVEASSQIAYHRTKAQAEQAVLTAAQGGKVPAVVVRPVISYGPGDRTGMVTQLLVRLAEGRFVPVGNGRNHVDLAYVDDVVSGMVAAWKRGRIGEVYILSGPQPLEMRTVLATACAVLERRGPGPLYVPSRLANLIAGVAEWAWGAFGRRPPLTRDAVATLTVDRGFSHERAARELGYRPKIDLGEGLRQTVEWLHAAGLTNRSLPEPMKRR